ncbi:hypothetical protein KOM00_06165 [Geomonas sp. Red69]|uniref:Uncharacterized protein n=1 Tax=Geomonas diazotrophica TaxID=2843197 RepID=A0ABX8JMH8_9BACT|nr:MULTISPECIES: hypothetical protein [Geomonas]MBU5636315.1 hypothetical protein [Geomonas diazotrophica]QWV99186.1 hypothetical protein KP005_07880 [Geomonas nitrogeniifigens]QXE88355.1 hypothetical protein KP003_08140 [Geomonas nitrogeniifigens]
MLDEDLGLDLGILCRCCDCRTIRLPDKTGLSESQVAAIEKLCKLCIESNKQYAVNS